MSTARTPFFHNSVGGYHGAKPKRIQELFDFYMSRGKQSVVNMLNVKYFIFKDNEGNLGAQKNVDACGNAWFVETVIKTKHPNEEIESLIKIDLPTTAVISNKSSLSQFKFTLDSLASIKLIKEHPHRLEYTSTNANINESEILKTNYAIRGLKIPAGNHKIVFKFEPQVVKTGSLISLIATIILLLIIVGSILYYRKPSN